MATLTVFANFYINSDETFQRMQDSFFSFKDITAEKWVVNVRGKYKKATLEFLKVNVGDKLITYDLESKEGWFFDTKQMLKDITTDFVFIWLEDHINLAPVGLYDSILAEMKESGAEYMSYSWWNGGELLEAYEDLPKKEMPHIYSFVLDKKGLKKVEEKHSTFIIGMVSIFSVDLFKKILFKTNMFLRQYPKFTPFNIEKGAGETSWLPIHYALPKQELFATIDAGKIGTSLQDRGLYPKRETRERGVPQKKHPSSGAKKYIPKPIYKRLIKGVIFYNRAKKYYSLLKKGW